MAVKQVLVLPTNPVDLKKIREIMGEVSDSMTRAEGEKTYQDEAISDLCEKFDLPKGQVKKLINMYHKSNRDAVVEEVNTLDDAYEAIFICKNVENQAA